MWRLKKRSRSAGKWCKSGGDQRQADGQAHGRGGGGGQVEKEPARAALARLCWAQEPPYMSSSCARSRSVPLTGVGVGGGGRPFVMTYVMARLQALHSHSCPGWAGSTRRCQAVPAWQSRGAQVSVRSHAMRRGRETLPSSAARARAHGASAPASPTREMPRRMPWKAASALSGPKYAANMGRRPSLLTSAAWAAGVVGRPASGAVIRAPAFK